MESKAILYHSNKKEACEQFASKEDYLIISENSKDDIWLGRGMYFWDNMGNARWWNEKQCKRNHDKVYKIVVANAELDELLDLTDVEVYKKLEELWQGICKKIDKDPNVPLGNKLNFFFDEQGFGNRYAIIKVYGKYNRTPNDGVFKFEYDKMRSEPTIAVKCIYSIRDSRCILEKGLIG
jgi:hypothetical protein